MNALIQTVAPTAEPVTLEEVKWHLRIDTDDNDFILEGMIKAAREHIEAILNRGIISQTWCMYLEDWPDDSDFIEIPYPPLQSITSIIYTDYDGTATTWVAATYYHADTNSEPGRVILRYGADWPAATLSPLNPIAITYVAGYSDLDSVPQSIKQAILLDVADLYENREGLSEKEMKSLPTLMRLLAPYIVSRFK